MRPCHFIVIARVRPPYGQSKVVRGQATGWQNTHFLETGTQLQSVAARFDDGNRGILIAEGQFRDLELIIHHHGEEPIEKGTRWVTDYSGGRLGWTEVIDVLGRHRDLLWMDPFEDWRVI
ncbi:hypothetical protein [Mitsuaria sp. GD03876]|uniref:hypothetical protein n=1 Tax=Mitsuaria sp. GD03876 TaxID=2975399 RepID=UPI0024475AA6|nr:hypothetical protein [Mitsuaria sp. GD03876]MDH0865852.1 hypothetical protein [Mitsuaria sp. GD03876]